MPLVAAHRISMHFGGPHLLQDLSLKVEPGDRVPDRLPAATDRIPP